jgi:3-deoxy-7-phosphoheptulonate synthase
MASLVFSTPDRPGALFAAMKVMAEASLNLKKLESRPIAGKPWQYMFYVDVEIPPMRDAFAQALEALGETVEDLRVLGSYRAN